MKRVIRRLAILTLSLPLVAAVVNDQSHRLTSVGKAESSTETGLTDSNEGEQGEMSKLVQTMMASGIKERY